MSKKNPHACAARDVPFPIRGGDYVVIGVDLARVEPPAKATEASEETPSAAAPVPEAPQTTTTTNPAARRDAGKKR